MSLVIADIEGRLLNITSCGIAVNRVYNAGYDRQTKYIKVWRSQVDHYMGETGFVKSGSTNKEVDRGEREDAVEECNLRLVLGFLQ